MEGRVTAIPTIIGIILITGYWLSMAGMLVNAYHYYNVRSFGNEKIKTN